MKKMANGGAPKAGGRRQSNSSATGCPRRELGSLAETMQATMTLSRAALAVLNDRNKIVALADDYWTLIADSDAKAEHAFENAFREARSRGHLTKDLFVRVARWKSVRNTRNYELNTETDIRTATAAAFQASNDAASIKALVQLHGVALRTASAILHWMRPERFPILDYRVVTALGETAPKSYDDIRLYIRIANRIRGLALHHSLDLRTIDRALWTWDKRRTLTLKPKCRKALALPGRCSEPLISVN
ncbi:MAG: hypothetical protein FJ398_05675 [Verrucomicrobia bacterium]|nr:hypothetical protein [Verrucomicrobiota bacterium]